MKEIRMKTAIIVIVALLTTGCASMKNTPQQDYTWEMGHKCNTTDLQMTRVEADGRYWVQGASNVIRLTPYFECMKEQQTLHPYSEWLKTQK